jgi:hypothetical protein
MFISPHPSPHQRHHPQAHLSLEAKPRGACAQSTKRQAVSPLITPATLTSPPIIVCDPHKPPSPRTRRRAFYRRQSPRIAENRRALRRHGVGSLPLRWKGCPLTLSSPPSDSQCSSLAEKHVLMTPQGRRRGQHHHQHHDNSIGRDVISASSEELWYADDISS